MIIKFIYFVGFITINALHEAHPSGEEVRKVTDILRSKILIRFWAILGPIK